MTAPSSHPLITPQALAARLHDQQQNQSAHRTVVFDCRFDLTNASYGEQAFADGHIPGAQFLHLERTLSGPKTGSNGRHPLPSRDALAAALAAAGASDDALIVAYDAQGGMYAARLWWLLRWLGHGSVAVLDGGWAGWLDAGGATEAGAGVAPPARGNFTVRAPLVATLDVDAVRANLDSRERLLVDARAPDRYRGENETLDPIGGHIPHAVNRFFKDNLGPDGRFKSSAALRADFAAILGDTPPARSVMQCGSGVTACHNALAMEIAGMPGAALYPGSWSEWSADATRPVATGPLP